MGRTSRKTETANIEEQKASDIQEKQNTEMVPEEQTIQESNVTEQSSEEVANKAEKKENIPPHVAELMRLYPHYEELWITSKGFVHPVGTPKYILKDATLYKNKFYNK